MIQIHLLPTNPPEELNRDEIEEQTKEYTKRIGELHELLRATRKRSLLVIFQGMDGSGKDGAVKSVFSKCVHNDLSVKGFKKPSEEEFAHDFLWRVHKEVPAKGEIKVFNRSHYEDVLIQRVHKWIDEKKVDARFNAINAFEQLLEVDNNTTVLKFFLHISHEQQEIELQQRIDEEDKHWKHNEGDWKEREFRDEYMHCYEEVLNRSVIPWIVVPVDKRWYRDYVISKAVCEAMESWDLSYPPLDRG